MMPESTGLQRKGSDAGQTSRLRVRRTVAWTLATAVAASAVAVAWAFLHNANPRSDSPAAAEAPRETSMAPSARPAPLPASPRAVREPLEELPGLEIASLPDPAAGLPETTTALFEEVKVAARGLADRFPDDPDALEMLARAHFWMGNSAEAVSAWRKCLELNPKYVYAYHGLGKVAVKKGNYDEAIRLLREALAVSADSSETEIELATAMVDAGQSKEAIDVLEPYVKKHARSAPALVLLGMACLEANDFQKARASYEAAVQIQPQHANAHYGLATAYARLGLKDKARESTERFNRLRAEEQRIRKDGRAAYDDVQQMRSLGAELLTATARIYHARGCTADAERLLRRAARIDPKAVECRQAVAWICREGGRLPEAIETLGQLAAADPGNPSYPLEIGRLRERQGQFDLAAQSFQAACRLAPKKADGFEALARLYLRANRNLPETVPLARKVVELKPAASSHALLGAACRRNGDRAAAASAFRQAVGLDPGNAEYRQSLESLNEEPGK